MLSHLLYDADLRHEQAAPCAGQSCAFSRNAQILARRAARDNIHGLDLRTVYLRNIAQVFHLILPVFFVQLRADRAVPVRPEAAALHVRGALLRCAEPGQILCRPRQE